MRRRMKIRIAVILLALTAVFYWNYQRRLSLARKESTVSAVLAVSRHHLRLGAVLKEEDVSWDTFQVKQKWLAYYVIKDGAWRQQLVGRKLRRAIQKGKRFTKAMIGDMVDESKLSHTPLSGILAKDQRAVSVPLLDLQYSSGRNVTIGDQVMILWQHKPHLKEKVRRTSYLLIQDARVLRRDDKTIVLSIPKKRLILFKEALHSGVLTIVIRGHRGDALAVNTLLTQKTLHTILQADEPREPRKIDLIGPQGVSQQILDTHID